MSVGESAVGLLFGTRFGFRGALVVVGGSEVLADSGVPVGTVPVGSTSVTVDVGNAVGVSDR